MKTREQLIGEIRYAIRLTQRTARLYRRVQTVGTFFGILGGSAAIGALAQVVPNGIGLAGGLLLAISGAAVVAIRPADKAAINEADTRRYELLKTKAHRLNDAALALAIDECHQGDAPEIESLRPVAFNDVAREFNRPDALLPLTIEQRILSAIA